MPKSTHNTCSAVVFALTYPDQDDFYASYRF